MKQSNIFLLLLVLLLSSSLLLSLLSSLSLSLSLLLLLLLLLLILISLILLIFDRNLFNTTLKLEQDLMVFGDWMIIIAWSLYLGQLSL